MKILFVAAEGAPFAKTGGLGDVIGALPKSLVKNGHEVAVILPYYDVVSAKFGDQVEDLGFFYTNVGWRRQYVGIKKIVRDGVTFFFIDNEQYFNRGTVYGEWDDGERFGFFQMAALELMEKVDFIPDILHVHDYHTAMIPFLLKEKYHWIQAYQGIKTVFTIHNIEFQGQFDSGMLWEIFGVGYERYADGTLRWNDCLNWMKAAVLYADRVTTVSPSYAGEIQTPELVKALIKSCAWNLVSYLVLLMVSIRTSLIQKQIFTFLIISQWMICQVKPKTRQFFKSVLDFQFVKTFH